MANPVALWYSLVIYRGLYQTCACVLVKYSCKFELVLYGFSTFKSDLSEHQAQRLRQNSGSHVIFNLMMRHYRVKHFLVDLCSLHIRFILLFDPRTPPMVSSDI